MRLKDLADKSKDLFVFALDKLHRDPNNPRENYDNVPDLAASMFQMDQLIPLEVRIEGDEVYITAGHRRLLAAKYVNEHYDQWLADAQKGDSTFVGYNFKEGLVCRAEPNGLDRVGRLFRQLLQGDHDQAVPLSPIEKAKAYKKLIEQDKLTIAEIARRVGKTAQQVSNILCLIEAPKELQDAVDQGNVKPTTATAITRMKDPDKKKAAIEKAKSGEKVKGSDVAEYVPLGLEKARKLIKKAQDFRDVSKSQAERAKWEGMIHGIEIGVGLRPAEF